MEDSRKTYLMQEYQATYMEYVHCTNEYCRIEQGGGAFTGEARQKVLRQLAISVTSLYMRLCFLSLVLQ